jgi:hypothetical protein
VLLEQDAWQVFGLIRYSNGDFQVSILLEVRASAPNSVVEDKVLSLLVWHWLNARATSKTRGAIDGKNSRLPVSRAA